MRKRLKLLLLSALFLGAARLSFAGDVNVVSGTDFGTRLTVDPTSNSAHFTEYFKDGSLGNPAARFTYMASTAGFSPVATATDVVTIAGSASVTVKVMRIIIQTSQTTTGINTWKITKRSSADTGGTSATMVKVPLDASNSAASAAVLRYTANPTGGGAVIGDIVNVDVNAPVTLTGAGTQPTVIDFVGLTGQPVILRGTAQQLAINFGGGAVPAGLICNFTIIWTEE